MAKIQIQQSSFGPGGAQESHHFSSARHPNQAMRSGASYDPNGPNRAVNSTNSTPNTNQINSAWGTTLSLRVEWVSNKRQGDQWGNAPYLFVKLKILDQVGDAHFEDWAGGFYLTAGEFRVSSAIFALDKPLADGSYTIRVFRSADGKTWVADGASSFTVGAPKSVQTASEQTTKSPGVPFQPEDEPVRWAIGTR